MPLLRMWYVIRFQIIYRLAEQQTFKEIIKKKMGSIYIYFNMLKLSIRNQCLH